MKAFSICACLLLAGVLLGILSCSGAASYVKKGPAVKTNTVKISNCKADPDTAIVEKGTPLKWIVDPPEPHTYSIKFPKSSPLASSSASTGQEQAVKGDFWCNTLGGISSGLCVYSYDITQDGGKTCPDPGVHVVPGP